MSNATTHKTYTLVWNNPRSPWHRKLYVHFVFRSDDQVDLVYKRCHQDPNDPQKYRTLSMGYDDPATGGYNLRLELHDGNSDTPMPVKTISVDHARSVWKHMTRLVVQSPEDTGWVRPTEAVQSPEDTGWTHTTY
jgi:hypothetical protein